MEETEVILRHRTKGHNPFIETRAWEERKQTKNDEFVMTFQSLLLEIKKNGENSSDWITMQRVTRAHDCESRNWYYCALLLLMHLIPRKLAEPWQNVFSAKEHNLLYNNSELRKDVVDGDQYSLVVGSTTGRCKEGCIKIGSTHLHTYGVRVDIL